MRPFIYHTGIVPVHLQHTIPNKKIRKNATPVDFVDKDHDDQQNDNKQTPSTQTPVIDGIPTSHTEPDSKENDDDTMATPTETVGNSGTGTYKNSEHISPSINTMTNQMETDLDEEIASIADMQTESHITDIAVVVDEIITQQLPTIVNKIRTELHEDFTTHFNDKFTTINDSIKSLKDELTTHHNKVLVLQKELANLVRDVHENNTKMTTEITNLQTKLENVHTTVPESHPTMQDRLDAVQQKLNNLVEQYESTGRNPPTQQQEELKQLYRSYRERIICMDNRIAKLNYEDIDLNMDTLLVSKMNAFDTYYLQKTEELETQHNKLVSDLKTMHRTQYVPTQVPQSQRKLGTDNTTNNNDDTNTDPNIDADSLHQSTHRNAPHVRSYQHNTRKMSTGADQGTGMNNAPTQGTVPAPVPVPVPVPVQTQKNERMFPETKNTSASSTYDVRTHNDPTPNDFYTYGQTTYDHTPYTNTYDAYNKPASTSNNSYSVPQNQNKPLYDDSPPHFHVTHHPHNPYNKMINTEYLRKHIKISCSDDSTLLEFYIKLRLLIKKGGIYLKPLDELSVDAQIYEEKMGYTTADYMNQSNGLHTLLSNEEIIPIEYTKAQNCIQATSDTMNGFAALKSMLTTVHPKFTKTQPDTTPPLYSMYNDLHLYEQSIRTYYLKHFLYDGYQRPELHKTEQYLKGLDAPEYENAKQRLIVQMDNLKIFGGDLPDQYNLTNISGTITNMDPYLHASTTPTVNTMQRSNHTNRPRSYQQGQTRSRETQNQLKQYTNTQCGACKLFGHRTNDCRHVGKILAVMDLQRTNPKLCSKILNSHIQKNNPDKRMKIIQSLQTINAIPQHANVDDYMLTDIIDDTITHTVNLTDNVIPDEIAPEDHQRE